MDDLVKLLRSFFARSDALQADLSVRWREHNNRRTVLALLVASTLAVFCYVSIIQPPEEFPVDRLVSVPSGASLKEVAMTLESEGVIRSPLAFRALVTLLGRERGARAGDYVFKEPENVWTVARAISMGAYGLEPIRIRVPEGAMVKEMAQIYSRKLQRFNAENFLAIATPQEGYLFPDTYFFLPNATEDTVLQSMRQGFDEQIAKIAPQIASSTRSLDEIVIMASIVEREARISADRKLIAGVLWNRISRGMALQVDVTFLYTEGKGTFQITTADLVDKSDAYNTYVHKGLPPGPIGSPSLDALLAAAKPAKTDNLYYLADRSGVTHFSRTYEEHLRKKAIYIDP